MPESEEVKKVQFYHRVKHLESGLYSENHSCAVIGREGYSISDAGKLVGNEGKLI
jgi:hypothetical protein